MLVTLFGWLEFAILVAASFLLFGRPASAADVFVGTPAFNPMPGQTFSIEILVDVGGESLGSYSLEFLFDPAVVNIVSISGGTTSSFGAVPITDPGSFSSGVTPIAAIHGPPGAPSGFVSIATLELEAAGSPGESSVLDVDSAFLFTALGGSLPVTIVASTVLVGPSTVPGLTVPGLLVVTTILLSTGASRARARRRLRA